jgi:tetratricopeptide (TPR) repeat protein
MPEPFYFICYSRVDGEDLALQLGDRLAAGPPSIPVWLDRRNLQPGIDWDEQIIEALRGCAGLLYLMTIDSVSPNSECKKEWTRALKYKKPIIPLLFDKKAELPFRLEPRQYIDLTQGLDAGLARLHEHVRWRETAEGALHTLKERLEDARRDLVRADAAEKVRITEEIKLLQQQIDGQQAILDNPEAAQERSQESITHRLEQERQPAEPVAAKVQTRFINRLPMIPPLYFQDRHLETRLIGNFLRDESLRLMIVVGRGGVGKTAMVCRLLRSLQGGQLPDDGGKLAVDGIVYLSARAGHTVDFPNLFFDLCKLLPETTAKQVEQRYRDPKQSTESQMQALLAAFPEGRTIVLLDNFEDVIDPETQAISDGDLEEALRTVLEAPPHGVKFILTTRVAPQALARVQPALQQPLELDEGLKAPYAEDVLKAMDAHGRLGLHDPTAPLAKAREATRGYPRALEAIVGILRTDRSTSLEGLLEELQQLRPKAEDVVRELVGEAFNRLDPLAQEVMQALAIYDVPVPAVAVDYLLQPYRTGMDSSKVLVRLVNMQFVRGEAGRFYLHRVDRDYAISRIEEGDLDDRAAEPPPFTRYALRHRAAEYYMETRKPSEAWRTLDDLAPQLAEFDQRVAGENYDAAAFVLREIAYDYLYLWGHYKLLADRCERLQGKETNPDLEAAIARSLGLALQRMGQYDRAIRCHEDSLALSRAQNDRLSEAGCLSNLGICYADQGDHAKAIELYRQILTIRREVGDKRSEAIVRGNLANSLSNLGRMAEATEQYEHAIALHKEAENRQAESNDTYNLADLYWDLGEVDKARAMAEKVRKLACAVGYRLVEIAAISLLAKLYIDEDRPRESIEQLEDASALADELNALQFQSETRRLLALALLQLGELARARTVADDAKQYRFPSSYPSVLALAGVVALRQGDTAAAREAFEAGVAEADELLAQQARPYDPAYAKALALAGLALCQDADLAADAAQAYREARAVSDAPGIVKSALRDLDALAAADPTGVLTPVRAAAAGEA